MTQATYEDANLILRLYELRREDKMRRARDWFVRDFSAAGMDEFVRKYPPGSEENAYFRMVVSYWDMACSFVVQGILHEELFYESSGESLAVWEKTKSLVAEVREAYKNPNYVSNLEKVSARRIAWMNQRAPGAYEAYLARIQASSR